MTALDIQVGFWWAFFPIGLLMSFIFNWTFSGPWNSTYCWSIHAYFLRSRQAHILTFKDFEQTWVRPKSDNIAVQVVQMGWTWINSAQNLIGSIPRSGLVGLKPYRVDSQVSHNLITDIFSHSSQTQIQVLQSHAESKGSPIRSSLLTNPEIFARDWELGPGF